MRHGPLSRESLVRGESEADLIAFGKSLRAQIAPMGDVELLLADRVVSCAWRLRRLLRVEALLFKEDAQVEQAFSHFGREKMAVFSRYEATVERSLFRALHELGRLQAARRGEPVPPLAVVDLQVAVARPDAMALTRENGEQFRDDTRGRAVVIET